MEAWIMKYEGKLYGRVGKHYFPLEATSEQFDQYVELLKYSRDIMWGCTAYDRYRYTELADKIDKLLTDNGLE